MPPNSSSASSESLVVKSVKSAANQFGLLPYQLAFAANPARFKIGLWARQTGKDHTCAFEAVADSLRHPGTLWLIVAAGERQALESLAKAREWAGQLQLAVDDYTEDRPGPQARIRSAEIRWANGSRLLALPANPQTVRGYSANVILTEFAFHENPDEIWRALYPSISNPLRGGPKKLRIISTPNGLRNKFAQLWHNPNRYHKTRVTIHDAVAAGLPLAPAELQAGLDDPDAWNQEYLCQFSDTSSVLLPYDLIESCESPEATASSTPQALSASALSGGTRPQLFAGIDFGRKKHLTVCWIFERLPRSAAALQVAQAAEPAVSQAAQPAGPRSPNHLLVTREVLTLKNMSVPDQIEALRPRLAQCRAAALDYTGLGIGLGDHLAREFGEHKPTAGLHGRVELCHFSQSLKAELFPRLRAAFEKHELLIPPHPDIREDLHGINSIVSATGQIAYRALSTADGHSDRCTALALALRAAQNTPVGGGKATLIGPPRHDSPYGPIRVLANLY